MNHDYTVVFGIIIGSIIISVALFLVCRELICWYWKINKIVALMEEQNKLLKEALSTRSVGSAENSARRNLSDSAKWKCPKCGADNPNTGYKCENCGYKLV